jgi:carboxyl-terminal processing protease
MRRALTAVVAAAVLVLPAAGQGGAAPAATRPRTAYEDLQMFSQVLNQIRVNHPDSVDTHALFMAAVEGMVQATDPHSYVIAATRLSPERERALRERRLHPVPIEWDYVGGSPVVRSVAPGTAAARQDILPGDLLVAADGQPIRAESAFELDVTLAGERGSSVNLRFERNRLDGSVATLDRTVRRERAEEGTAVPAVLMLDDTTGYVRVTTFSNERTAEDVNAGLEQLERRGMRRLVLDLRDNGGGLVDEASRVAGAFLPAGSLVYTAEGRKAEVGDTVRVRRSFFRQERRYPVVLMVNEGSASASELVAGALQDHDRALVVGRPTFGKSLLMRGFPLTDGSVMVLVIGHIRTPCGRVVQRQYRDLRVRDYYRMSRAERDTAGRPSCRTTGGRTVYGGGGIYPDVLMAERDPAPVWLARLGEDDLFTRWAAAYLGGPGASAVASEDALLTLPPAAVADFRAFAARSGHTPPEGAEADTRIRSGMARALAFAKFGEGGMFRLIARMDPQVREAARQFPRAAAILGSSQ